jgi:hypothetical protein
VKTSLVVVAATVMVVVVDAERRWPSRGWRELGVCHCGNSHNLLSFIFSRIPGRYITTKANIYDFNIVYLYLSAQKASSSSKLATRRRTGPNNAAERSQASTFGKTRKYYRHYYLCFCDFDLISAPHNLNSFYLSQTFYDNMSDDWGDALSPPIWRPRLTICS